MATTYLSTDTNVDLVINRLSRSTYDWLSSENKLDPNQLYLIDDEVFDMFNKRVVRVAEPTDVHDATNVGYVDTYYVPRNKISAYFDSYRILSGDGSRSLAGDLTICKSTVGDWKVTVESGSVDPSMVTVQWDSNPGTGYGWNFIVNGTKVPTGNTNRSALAIQAMFTYEDESTIIKGERAISWDAYDRVVPYSELSTFILSAQGISSCYTKSETSSATELDAKFSTLSTYSEISSQLSNDGYLTAHQSLDNYYTKSQTSSDVEISEALDKKANADEVSNLSNDLSSAISTDIKNLADNYAKKTEINVNYISEDKKIYLSAGDHVTSIDTDDFIKDGMISAVTYDETTHMLCIVWNTDAGGKTTTINLSGLIDTYTAGYGLSLANGEFSVDTEEIAQKSDLDNYYLTSETSSATEISSAFDAIPLSDFVKLSSDSTQDLKTNLSIDGFVAIGSASIAASPDANYVRYDAPQSITNAQKRQLATNCGYRYQLVNLEGVVEAGYLTFQLEDYAVNCIEITSNNYPVKIKLPEIADASSDVKRAREFIAKVKVTVSTPPSCTFVKSDSDTSVGFEAADYYWQDLYSGVNLFTFNETERA